MEGQHSFLANIYWGANVYPINNDSWLVSTKKRCPTPVMSTVHCCPVSQVTINTALCAQHLMSILNAPTETWPLSWATHPVGFSLFLILPFVYLSTTDCILGDYCVCRAWLGFPPVFSNYRHFVILCHTLIGQTGKISICHIGVCTCSYIYYIYHMYIYTTYITFMCTDTGRHRRKILVGGLKDQAKNNF